MERVKERDAAAATERRGKCREFPQQNEHTWRRTTKKIQR
jgi:hypothetical protein